MVCWETSADYAAIVILPNLTSQQMRQMHGGGCDIVIAVIILPEMHRLTGQVVAMPSPGSMQPIEVFPV
jgi:hypothetical protein